MSAAFLRPLAADDVIGGPGEEIHGNDGELLGRATLQEEHIVRARNSEEAPAACDGFIENRIELLASVAAFGDAEALALEIQEGCGRGFENLVGEGGGTGGEVVDAFFHGGRIVEAALPC